MPDDPTYAHGKICYVELPADDVERSADFYRTVFGWETRKRGDGATAFSDTVGQVAGAFVRDRSPAAEAGLLLYVMVADIDTAARAVVKNGGTIVQPTDRSVPEITARFRDPAGNLLGLYEERALSKR